MQKVWPSNDQTCNPIPKPLYGPQFVCVSNPVFVVPSSAPSVFVIVDSAGKQFCIIHIFALRVYLWIRRMSSCRLVFPLHKSLLDPHSLHQSPNRSGPFVCFPNTEAQQHLRNSNSSRILTTPQSLQHKLILVCTLLALLWQANTDTHSRTHTHTNSLNANCWFVLPPPRYRRPFFARALCWLPFLGFGCVSNR